MLWFVSLRKHRHTRINAVGVCNVCALYCARAMRRATRKELLRHLSGIAVR